MDEELDLWTLLDFYSLPLETSLKTNTYVFSPSKSEITEITNDCRSYSGYVSGPTGPGVQPTLAAPGVVNQPPGLGATPLPPGVVSRCPGVSWYLWAQLPTHQPTKGAPSPQVAAATGTLLFCSDLWLWVRKTKKPTSRSEEIRGTKHWYEDRTLGGFDGKWIPLVNGKGVDFMVDNGKITTTSKGKTLVLECTVFPLNQNLIWQDFGRNFIPELGFSFRLDFWAVPKIPRLKISLDYIDAWKLWMNNGLAQW